MSPSSSTVHISSHPIVATKVCTLRDKSSSSKTVRDVMNDLAILLGYEATQDLELRKTETVSMMVERLWFFHGMSRCLSGIDAIGLVDLCGFTRAPVRKPFRLLSRRGAKREHCNCTSIALWPWACRRYELVKIGFPLDAEVATKLKSSFYHTRHAEPYSRGTCLAPWPLSREGTVYVLTHDTHIFANRWKQINNRYHCNLLNITTSFQALQMWILALCWTLLLPQVCIVNRQEFCMEMNVLTPKIGNTAIAAVHILKEWGIPGDKIKFIGVLGVS